jgi:purine-nucleoside phosphorylase
MNPNARQFLINEGFNPQIDTVVILGSGLGGFTSTVNNAISVPYDSIPDFPVVTVVGHGGELIQGQIGNKEVMVFSGRFHHYEGHPFEKTIIPVRLAAEFNAKNLIVSNAAGGINTRYKVGDLMLIDDFMRVGFPVMPFGKVLSSRFNNAGILEIARQTAVDLKIEVRQGTYLYVKGPVYETKAEIRAYRTLGVDVVGMSTVPELLEASNLGINSLGITLITNMATGVTNQKLEHEEIKEVADSRKVDFGRLVSSIISRLDLLTLS